MRTAEKVLIKVFLYFSTLVLILVLNVVSGEKSFLYTVLMFMLVLTLFTSFRRIKVRKILHRR